MKKILTTMVLWVSIPLGMSAQTEDLDDYYVDFTAPDLSAFQLLGNTSNDVSRPSSLKELSTGLLGLNKEGKVNPGVALEWSPGYSIGGRNQNISTYRTNYLLYALQLTAGSLKDSSGTNLAIGLKWTPINRMDIVNDRAFGYKVQLAINNNAANSFAAVNRLQTELGDYLENDLNIANTDPRYLTIMNLFPLGAVARLTPVTQAAIVAGLPPGVAFNLTKLQYFVTVYNEIIADYALAAAALENNLKTLKENWLEDHWNSMVLQISTGFKLNSKSERWEDLEGQKFVSYANFAYPIGNSIQNIWQSKYDHFIGGDTVNLSVFSLGTRFLIGNEATRFSIEGNYTMNDGRKKETTDQRLKVTVGLEFQVSQGLWLEIAGGLNQSVLTGTAPTSVAALNFKYALQKQRRFDVN